MTVGVQRTSSRKHKKHAVQYPCGTAPGRPKGILPLTSCQRLHLAARVILKRVVEVRGHARRSPGWSYRTNNGGVWLDVCASSASLANMHTRPPRWLTGKPLDMMPLLSRCAAENSVRIGVAGVAKRPSRLDTLGGRLRDTRQGAFTAPGASYIVHLPICRCRVAESVAPKYTLRHRHC